VLNKVSSIVKNNFSNLRSAIGLSNPTSALKNLNPINAPNFNNPQQVAQAAKILNKSPFEADDFNAADGHIKANPFAYGVVHYPEDVSSLGSGHYLMIDIFINNKSKFLSAKDPRTLTRIAQLDPRIKNQLDNTIKIEDSLEKSLKIANLRNENLNTVAAAAVVNKLGFQSAMVKSGIRANNNTHVFISDTIVLYTPPNVKTNYAVTYDTPETGGAGAALGGQGLVEALISFAGRDAFLGGFGALPGAGDPASALSKKGGEARNPNLEVVFKSVPFRKFDYTFEFAPKNKKEVDSVDKIIKLLRYHMQPELQGGSSSFFTVPSEFQLTYMYIDRRNLYIPKISRCVLESLELDQSPENVFTTFQSDEIGAFPTLTKMTLSFTETEIMTKQKIADGF
jgi:hypothetical protein